MSQIGRPSGIPHSYEWPIGDQSMYIIKLMIIHVFFIFFRYFFQWFINVHNFLDQPPHSSIISIGLPTYRDKYCTTIPFLDARGVRVVLKVPLGQKATFGLLTWPKPGSCQASHGDWEIPETSHGGLKWFE